MLCPFFASCARQSSTSPFIAVRLYVRDVRILYGKTDKEFLVFITLIRKSQSDKAGFSTGLKPDLSTHWNVSQSHRTVSIFETGLLWSVWETASVFGHWLEHFWKGCIIRAAQEGLRYFSKGQQTASAFHVQLSYHWQLICLDAWCPLNEHTELMTLWFKIFFNQKSKTDRRTEYKSNSWQREMLRSGLCFVLPFMNLH